MRSDGLKECSGKCLELSIDCPNEACKHWISFSKEKNCSLISIKQNGNMTLRQVAERMQLSFARIKQIETKALNKIKKRAMSLNAFF